MKLILKWSKEFIRYAIVGAVTNVSGFLLYVLLTTLGVTPILTISLFYPIHIGSAFYLNKKWSFSHEGRISALAIRYLISYIGCYILNVAALKYFDGYLGFSHVTVQAVAVLIIIPLLFVTQKLWVFREDAASILSTQAS